MALQLDPIEEAGGISGLVTPKFNAFLRKPGQASG
jgi:hypothetical protein